MAATWIRSDEIPSDKFALLEINEEDAVISPTMSYSEITEFAMNRYKEQTLDYFNFNKNLFIINISRKSIRPLSIKLEI